MNGLPDPRQMGLPAGAFVVVLAAGQDVWRLSRESSPTVSDVEERVTRAQAERLGLPEIFRTSVSHFEQRSQAVAQSRSRRGYVARLHLTADPHTRVALTPLSNPAMSMSGDSLTRCSQRMSSASRERRRPYTARAMYVLIRTNSDRLSGHLASREEAADAWRWLVADSRAHSDTFAVQELDEHGGLVGPAITPDLPPAAPASHSQPARIRVHRHGRGRRSQSDE